MDKKSRKSRSKSKSKDSENDNKSKNIKKNIKKTKKDEEDDEDISLDDSSKGKKKTTKQIKENEDKKITKKIKNEHANIPLDVISYTNNNKITLKDLRNGRRIFNNKTELSEYDSNDPDFNSKFIEFRQLFFEDLLLTEDLKDNSNNNPLGQVRASSCLLSTFCYDDEFIEPMIKSFKMPSIIIRHAGVNPYANMEECHTCQYIKYIYPKISKVLKWGTFHSKLMLLKFPNFLRVVIPTANLTNEDWYYWGQLIWFQDFPLINDEIEEKEETIKKDKKEDEKNKKKEINKNTKKSDYLDDSIDPADLKAIEELLKNDESNNPNKNKSNTSNSEDDNKNDNNKNQINEEVHSKPKKSNNKNSKSIKEQDEEDDKEAKSSEFREYLERFMKEFMIHTYEQKRCWTDLNINLIDYDFSDSAIDIIATVNGRFSGEEFNLFGTARLNDLIKTKYFYMDPNDTLLVQCSSFGNSKNKNFFKNLYNGFNLKEDPNVDIFYPSTDYVKSFPLGEKLTSCLFMNQEFALSNKDKMRDINLKSEYSKYKTIFHSKCFITGKRNELGKFILNENSLIFVGSQNLSVSAWGGYEKNNTQICMANYECGILFDNTKLSFLERLNIFNTLMFNFDCEKYKSNQNAFIQEIGD